MPTLYALPLYALLALRIVALRIARFTLKTRGWRGLEQSRLASYVGLKKASMVDCLKRGFARPSCSSICSCQEKRKGPKTKSINNWNYSDRTLSGTRPPKIRCGNIMSFTILIILGGWEILGNMVVRVYECWCIWLCGIVHQILGGLVPSGIQ